MLVKQEVIITLEGYTDDGRDIYSAYYTGIPEISAGGNSVEEAEFHLFETLANYLKSQLDETL